MTCRRRRSGDSRSPARRSQPSPPAATVGLTDGPTFAGGPGVFSDAGLAACSSRSTQAAVRAGSRARGSRPFPLNGGGTLVDRGDGVTQTDIREQRSAGPSSEGEEICNIVEHDDPIHQAHIREAMRDQQ